MGQHLVTHDPSDFRDPFDPWPIPCSGIANSNLYLRIKISLDYY